MPVNIAAPVTKDKTKAYPSKILKDAKDEAESVSTYRFITPVSTFACIEKQRV